METVGTNSLFSILEYEQGLVDVSNKRVRENKPAMVHSYAELARAVSSLQFRNQDLVLLFRGQRQDYKEGNQTTIRPSIFRGDVGSYSSKWSKARQRKVFKGRHAHAFEKLREAEALLLQHYRGSSIEAIRIRRQRIVRWSVLQHYEICPTPLLDVTHSLRIAASFATLDGGQEGCIMVIGVPNISGAITASAEAGLQIVRLSSVCPPEAARPHLQEGYLISEYPELGDPQQASLYDTQETDVALRLVAKFSFDRLAFWSNSPNFPAIPRNALFPDSEADDFLKVAEEIKRQVSTGDS